MCYSAKVNVIHWDECSGTLEQVKTYALPPVCSSEKDKTNNFVNCIESCKA